VLEDRSLRAAVVARPGYRHQELWGAVFAQGLRRHGVKVALSCAPEPCDLLVLWGVLRQDWIEEQKRAGGQVCILERAYLGSVHDWASVSFGGGLAGRAEWRVPPNDPSRWGRHFAHVMQPWRQRPDGYALVCGQVPSDMAVAAVNIDAFCCAARDKLQAQGFWARYRPHPNVEEPPHSLEDDLADARCVVTFNSTIGVDAVLAGVPTVAMDRGSMAWEVAGHELAMPPTPDRTAWAHRLAWCQWSAAEMASGACWEAVGACARAA
jgi:hypothetical protein